MLQMKVYICCKTSIRTRSKKVHLKTRSRGRATKPRKHRRTIKVMKLLRVVAHDRTVCLSDMETISDFDDLVSVDPKHFKIDRIEKFKKGAF